jgi:hypothetical protein
MSCSGGHLRLLINSIQNQTFYRGLFREEYTCSWNYFSYVKLWDTCNIIISSRVILLTAIVCADIMTHGKKSWIQCSCHLMKFQEFVGVILLTGLSLFHCKYDHWHETIPVPDVVWCWYNAKKQDQSNIQI